MKKFFFFTILAFILVLSGCISDDRGRTTDDGGEVADEQEEEIEVLQDEISFGGGGGGTSVSGPASDPSVAEWTVYRNEEFGYEVTCPKGWYKLDTSVGYEKGVYNIAFSTNSTGIWSGEDEFALIYIARGRNHENLPIEQWYEDLPEEDKSTHRYIIVDGIKSIEADGSMGHAGKIVMIPREDKIYHIRITTEGSQDQKEELDNIFHQVVSTFKFIK